MDLSKSKSTKLLRKITSAQIKPQDYLYDLSNYKSYLDNKKHNKPLIKNISKPYDQFKKVSTNKTYLINKTAIGSPYEKQAMFSYLSTPNEKSFNIERLKTIKCEGEKKMKEQFQSTEDDNFGEQLIKVSLLLSEKKTLSRSFIISHNLNSIFSEFQKEILEFVQKSKKSYYGLLGFQTIPFNYQLTYLINQNKQATFQFFVDKNIKELTLVPCFLKRPISYEALDFSDFEIIKFLGNGGFSQVYLAKCKLDFQYCALKFIAKESITSSKKLKMLQNEKNILFSIKHENLIDLYYAFQTKNYIVFGLEYCPNGNLYSYLQRTKNLSESQAKHIMVQILNGLEYLHKNNILFRDIKLQNILFDINGKIKITDFGLSKPDIDEDEITYSYCGSPQYMAPEMLTKSGHSYQVDFYALGILLYELLFGRSPFYAPKKEDIFNAILHSEPHFPKTPSISKEVKSLIRGLLAKNPNHRIGSLKGIKQILTHPWFKNQNNELVSINDNYLYENKGLNKKEFQEAKQVFINEQFDKKFQKMFFSQNFVNRELCSSITQRIRKFPQREERQSKGILLKTSCSKRK